MGKWFRLENDADQANVRFISESMDDLDVVSYHEVEDNGPRRRVSCIEERCPLCKVGAQDTPIGKRRVSVFFALVDRRDGNVKFWERSMWSVEKELKAALERARPICGREFNIMRRGAKGDRQTRYNIFPEQDDGTTIDKLPPRPPLFGDEGVIAELSRSELEEIVARIMTPDVPRVERAVAQGADVF